jgi:hypothetical protein
MLEKPEEEEWGKIRRRKKGRERKGRWRGVGGQIIGIGN